MIVARWAKLCNGNHGMAARQNEQQPFQARSVVGLGHLMEVKILKSCLRALLM